MMNSALTDRIIDQLHERGIDMETLNGYHRDLVNGYPYIGLAQNCRIGKEILQLSPAECERSQQVYQQRGSGCKVVKFVPASGAASRMFKDLFAHLESGKENEGTKTLFANLEHFPFAKALNDILSMPKELPLQDSITRMDILKAILLREGLNYGHLPKGLILFHRYSDGHARTAFEEHFYEASLYARSGSKAHIHFTVPDNTQREVELHLAHLKDSLSRTLGVEFEIETSLQKPSTDTPAIYQNDHAWVTTDDGSLLLRPAGHGALLDNLNDLDADIIFVKNIDNVVPDHLKGVTVQYKEAIAGVLLEVQASIFKFLQQLDKGSLDMAGCTAFFSKWFQQDIQGMEQQEIRNLLDRPIRVCGMVKNEGEPGGGPFLVDEGHGHRSLQIVEKAQVDISKPEQVVLLNAASHFNPVDLVLSVKNHKGEKYDLMRYRNPNTGMVVSKTHMGRDIFALELPGLWNGSMHHWNTIFVEVPIETFNPVKTVFDLLRPSHQGN